MIWQQTISLGRPLRDVEVIGPNGRDQRQRQALEAETRRREEAAYQRGLAEGEKRLDEQLVRQRSELLELQNGALSALRQAVPEVIRQSESVLLELALQAAQKLICGLPVSVEMVEAAVRSAVAQAEESSELRVYLHPEDLALLQQNNSPMLLPGVGRPALHLEASTEVSRGGCLVQTRFGVVDACRETKLQLLREAVGV